MHVGASVKPICEHCKVIRRTKTLNARKRKKGGRARNARKRVLMVVCAKNARHKQRQG